VEVKSAMGFCCACRVGVMEDGVAKCSAWKSDALVMMNVMLRASAKWDMWTHPDDNASMPTGTLTSTAVAVTCTQAAEHERILVQRIEVTRV